MKSQITPISVCQFESVNKEEGTVHGQKTQPPMSLWKYAASPSVRTLLFLMHMHLSSSVTYNWESEQCHYFLRVAFAIITTITLKVPKFEHVTFMASTYI